MKWRLHGLLLGLVLLGSGLVLAAELSGIGPTDSGYYFTARSMIPVIYVHASAPEPGSQIALIYPPATSVIVTVVNAAGQPIEGVPVTFKLTQGFVAQDALILSPKRTTTNHDGRAEAILQPIAGKSEAVFQPLAGKAGIGSVLVQVDNLSEEVKVDVALAKGASGSR
jgi:hypothetical protein